LVVSIDQFLFVFENLSVQLVCELVYGGVKVVAICFGEHFGATKVDGRLCALSQFLNTQDDVDVGNVVEVAFKFLQLLGYVASQRVCYIDVMSGNA
jgi:hypothetical protein